MYRKCNVHIKELIEIINTTYYKINMNVPIEYKIHTTKNLIPLNKRSSIGEQIKYHRRYNRITQEELSGKLSISKYSIMHLENDNVLLYDLNIVKAIIEELDIKHKININDDYLKFILDSPSRFIKQYRKKNNITRYELSKKLDVMLCTIKKWETDKSVISRKSYEKIKELI